MTSAGHSVRLILNIALSLSAVGVVVRAASAVKEIVFAGAFGVSADTDAFVLAFTYATFLPSVLGSSVGMVLIPTLSDPNTTLRGIGLVTLAIWIAVASIACAALIYVCAPFLIPRLFSIEPEVVPTAVHFARVMSVLGGTLFISQAMSALLNSAKQFYLPGFIPMVTPMLIMAAIVFLAYQWGVAAAAWGAVVGGVTEFALLASRIAAQRKVFFRPGAAQDGTDALRFWKSVGLLSVASGLAAISPMVDQIFLARLETGAITHFNYASKVNSVLIGLFGTAFTVAVYPYLSDLAARADTRGLKQLIARLAGIMLPVTALAACVVYVYSYELIDLLFARGKFTADATIAVGEIQRVFAIQLVLYVAMLFAMPVLNAMRATRFIFYVACAAFVTNVLFDWLLYREFGARGIAFSSVMAAFVSLACALFFIRIAMARMSLQSNR